jgi:hypothetical protein
MFAQPIGLAQLWTARDRSWGTQHAGSLDLARYSARSIRVTFITTALEMLILKTC